MYHISSFHMGSTPITSVKNEHGAGIEFSPNHGGAIHQLYMGDKATPILLPFHDEEDLQSNPRYKQALLFPFPNRLADGTFTFNYRTYRFPINEPARNNALHGFLSQVSYEVLDIDLASKDEAIIILRHRNETVLDYFPYPFEITLKYTLTPDTFELTFEVRNIGSNAFPYGFGWHPYFRFPGEVQVNLPKTYKQELDIRNLPTGKEAKCDASPNGLDLTNGLDDCFRLEPGSENKVILTDKKNHRLELVSDSSLSYVQLYTFSPDTIAAEPMSCTINGLNNQQGIILLGPGETKKHSSRIFFHSEDKS